MTAPRQAEGPASRSGVRRSGDAYQDLVVWGAAMRVIGPGSRFTQVEVEVNGVGNVDDVILRSSAGDLPTTKSSKSRPGGVARTPPPTSRACARLHVSRRRTVVVRRPGR